MISISDTAQAHFRKLLEKQPDGTKSPNLADSVMISYAPMNSALNIWELLGRQA